jgi:hypothetical protein
LIPVPENYRGNGFLIAIGNRAEERCCYRRERSAIVNIDA